MITLNDSLRIAYDTSMWAVGKLSTNQLKTIWIPILISVLAFTVSVITFFYTKKLNKRNLLRVYIKEISASKQAAEDIGSKMAPLLGKKKVGSITPNEQEELAFLYKTLESRNDNTLNNIEIACASYYLGELIKSEFISHLEEDIERFVNGNKTKYAPPFTSYPKTLLFYEQICRRRKSKNY